MSTIDEKQLGRRLQKARQAAGLTQQELCHRASLSYSTLAKIERGAIKTPSIFTIQSIAGALGVGLDELVGVPPAPSTQRRRSRSGVRFVYFDVNNCLVGHNAFNYLSEVCDLPPDVIETAMWRYDDLACRGEMTIEEFNQKIGELLHLPGFDWRNFYFKAVKATTGMHDFVAWVHEHYGVGLLTNSMPGFVPRLIADHVLPDVRYDAVIDSSEVHLMKPEKEMYQIALERAGCAPEEILFTDDTRANLMAAERLGWHVMLFDDLRPAESIARLKAALELADS